ncbi:competence-induced protein Ccs50 [Streptococcus pneumoniae]|nr:competence-induced protein Ccs50 [Streptococcus pneumoniae]
MKISHMKKDELFEGFYLIKSADLRQTRAGKNYLAFTFQDDSGEIDGKLWDAQPHNIEAFTAGKVVHMKGRREVYNNTPQVNQITLRLPQAGEPNDPADFKVKSPVDVKEIRDYMSQMIFKIENPVWQRIVRNLYTKYDKEFYSYPAAKTNHHAFETGLAYHTATMVTVSKQLESVNRGLGEMQTVARDVGALNKVLSGTKTRGILGELQLGQIIEDIMTPAQYEREYATVENSSERVEYAIKLPGQGDQEYVYLPIDSKFPLADYYRLEEAYETGDKDEIERCRKSLLASVKRFAKDIKSKYIAPPRTTNFGILFVPTEGLYSEIVRNPVFFDDLRREEQIIVAGPSTLSALLNSLSVGFKTLNIQKSADHISKTLASVKTEFGKFGGILVKAQKHLQHASGNIDELLNRRTIAIERTLRHIELSEGEPALDLLHFQENEEEYED